MILTKEQIQKADDLPRQLVPVPEWGGEVYVRTLTSEAADNWDAQIQQGEKLDRDNILARFAALVLCDEAGNKMFSHQEAEQLGQKSTAAMRRIWRAGMKLNGMSGEAIEDAKKNSGSAPASASPSDSASPSAV